jgi:hypothetical protein
MKLERLRIFIFPSADVGDEGGIANSLFAAFPMHMRTA